MLHTRLMEVSLLVVLIVANVCVNIPPSTSPAIQSLTPLTPVSTTDMYCAALLTISFSRFSMYSRDVASQVSGNSASVSNL